MYGHGNFKAILQMHVVFSLLVKERYLKGARELKRGGKMMQFYCNYKHLKV